MGWRVYSKSMIVLTGQWSILDCSIAAVFSLRHSTRSATAITSCISNVVPALESCSQPVKVNGASKSLNRGSQKSATFLLTDKLRFTSCDF